MAIDRFWDFSLVSANSHLEKWTTIPIADSRSNSIVLRSPDTTAPAATARSPTVQPQTDEKANSVSPENFMKASATHETQKSLSKMECDSSVPSPPLDTGQKPVVNYQKRNDDAQTVSRDIYSFASSVHSRCLNGDDSPDSDDILEISVTSAKDDAQCGATSVEKCFGRSSRTSDGFSFKSPETAGTGVKSPESRRDDSANLKAAKIPKKRKSNEVARLLTELSDSSFMFEMRKKEAQLRRKLGQGNKTTKSKSVAKGIKRKSSISDDDRCEDSSEQSSSSENENSDDDRQLKPLSICDSDEEVLSRLGGSGAKPRGTSQRKTSTTIESCTEGPKIIVERKIDSPVEKATTSRSNLCSSTRRSISVSSSENSSCWSSTSDDDKHGASARTRKAVRRKADVTSKPAAKSQKRIKNATQKGSKINSSIQNRSRNSSSKKMQRARKKPVKSATAYLKRENFDDHEDLPGCQRDLFWSYHDPTVACAAGNSCLKPTDSEVQWVQCDKCSGWYHVDCVDCNFEAIKDSDAEFACDTCKV